jgi:hypothetical protein
VPVGLAHDVGVAGHFVPFELSGGKGLIGMGDVWGLRGPSTSLRFAQDDEIFVLVKKDKGKSNDAS